MADDVKSFVRNKLGCDCSEDVFKHIVNERDIRVGDVALRNKLNIGDRLLVYVVEPGHWALIDAIPLLVRAGREERDSKGFNRFRLVIVSDDERLKKQAFEKFKSLPGLDEKIHLHVVCKSDASGL